MRRTAFGSRFRRRPLERKGSATIGSLPAAGNSVPASAYASSTARAAKSAGGGNPVEFEEPGGRLQVENRPRAGDRADLPPRSAGQAAETAEPGWTGTRGGGATARADAF